MDWARFWAVDLHVHTPASDDAKEEHYGTPDDIVDAAIAAGLDAVAITDHNTADWCEAVAEAAGGKALVVLPGVEISTTEGHLLGIWEVGTSAQTITEVLTKLGIGQAERGRLDVATDGGLAQAAAAVRAGGGVAIAAHVDKPKGLLKLAVKAQVQKILLHEALSAVEVCHLDTVTEIGQKVNGSRTLACVRSSDTWDTANSRHALSGIGVRRTWVKASRPDLRGIQHALADPELRISLEQPAAADYPVIDSIAITGGFLNGQTLELGPDLNCLVGGTGAGKSLVLEALRFALDQQVDRAAFPTIGAEVDARLESALGSGSLVKIEFTAKGETYRAERSFDSSRHQAPTIFQRSADEWVEIDTTPEPLVRLAAFSQGEILEYSRQPVGRMALIDAGIDLSEIEARIHELERNLSANADELLTAFAAVDQLVSDAENVTGLADQVRTLGELFETDLVKQQDGWAQESATLRRITKALAKIEIPTVSIPATPVGHTVPANKVVFESATVVLDSLRGEVEANLRGLSAAVETAKHELASLQGRWATDFAAFNRELDDELEKVDPDASLKALRAQLASLQGKLATANSAQEELTEAARPRLDEVSVKREKLLSDLRKERRTRRDARRRRVNDLNVKTAGFVKLDVPDNGDYDDFRQALNTLKVGSHVRAEVLEAIARNTHPFKFSRSLWNRDISALANPGVGIDSTSIAKLLTNIADRDLWKELLAIQLIDRPDILSVKFKKPGEQIFTPIERLAHGQKCTAVLVILLADGTMPVIVDQPEDALHAPWIEDYLVDRLRQLRGLRQYVFATRSSGIVVSGDAEQIITMRSTADRGELEASGSLDRFDINTLVLQHLEGGPIPFDRRFRKLKASVDQGRGKKK